MTWLSISDLREKGFASLGKNVLIDRTVEIYRPEKMCIGSNVRIDSSSELVAGPGVLAIGNHVHISRGCVIHAAAGVTLENFVGLSPSVHVLSECDDYSSGALTNPTVPRSFRRVTSLSILIERHVAIGAGSIILPGTKIGWGASVCAMTVVLGRVGDGEIVRGNPHSRIGKRNLTTLARNEEKLMRKVVDSD